MRITMKYEYIPTSSLTRTLPLFPQVITWFQNRRAKLKRDMEELKRDVECTKVISSNKTLLEASVNVAALLKVKEFPRIPITSLPH